MYNPFKLVGKTILVTGSSSGIGASAAIECAKLGAKLVVTGRNQERLNCTFVQLEGDYHQKLVCDLSDINAVMLMVDELPLLDGVILNAGISKLVPIQFVKENELLSILQVNTVAPILLLQQILKKKKLNKGGSVVFTSSLAGIGTTSTGNSMYSASKGAVSAFIKAAAIDLASKQIRVNAVCPGMVNTHLIEDSLIQEQIEKDVKNYPLGRYGEPRDVALAMVYLLSDASKWVTGTNMIIDGGLTTK